MNMNIHELKPRLEKALKEFKPEKINNLSEEELETLHELLNKFNKVVDEDDSHLIESM